MLEYFVNNPIPISLLIGILIGITWYVSSWGYQFKIKHPQVKLPFTLLEQMKEQNMIIIIRLEKELFQIIYNDGKAINTWHPDLIKQLDFMENNELLVIKELLKLKGR